MYFDTKHLELNKVLEQLLPFAKSNQAKNDILNIKPTSSMDDVKLMLDETDEAFSSIVKLSDLPLDGFKSCKDSILRAKVSSILSEEELYNIAQMLSCSRNILRYKQDLLNEHVNIDNLLKYFDNILINKKIEDEIYGAIAPDLHVVDNASMKLFRIRKKLKMEETHVRNLMNSMIISHSKMLRDNIVTLRDGHYCLSVKAENKNSIKGIVRDSSSSGTTYFIEPEEAYKISASIELIRQEEKQEVEEILKTLSVYVTSISDELLLSYDNIIKLDIIFAKAAYALKNNYTKPTINDEGIIEIKDGAHPLIDKDVVVKNDVELGKNYDTIIITGPNTGGKTVVLKMVGLITLMAQTGLFIPCKEGSVINVFDNIYSDIGDEQSIEQSLSTFSSHITNVSKIISEFTYNSLILLDELGSGTDPKEGSSLAIAIIDYLTKKGAKVITTTHYSDLKAFAYNNKRIINASVEFQSETLMPTYKLLIGVAGKSNAFHISKRLGIKDEILEKAKSIYDDSQSDTSTLINQIDDENEKIIKLKQEYALKIDEYNKKLHDLELEKNNIELNVDKILSKANKEAKEIISTAKEKSKDIIDELNKLKQDEYFKEHKLADLKHDLRSLDVKENKESVFNEEIKVGDYVTIKSYGQNGEVKRINKDTYEVQVGNFTMKFNRSDIALLHHKIVSKQKVIKKNSSFLVTKAANASIKLDLRGYRYDEVHDKVDKFIDDALSNNFEMIYIVHGFGTGAVREAVQSYLKKCPYVKSYRYGGEGEGLNGCTVVYLK